VQHGLTYPILRDPCRALRRALGADTVPRTLIIDREGNVIAHHRGYRGDITPIYRDLRRLGLPI
jgi:hypothetical protein